MTTPRVGSVQKCHCGDDMKLVDLREGPFGMRTGPRYGWQHVVKMRNFSHQARLP